MSQYIDRQAAERLVKETSDVAFNFGFIVGVLVIAGFICVFTHMGVIVWVKP